MSSSTHDSVNRQILDLAVPALGALVAEPLFLMADSAVIGHVGTGQLAGLGVASTALLTATGLFVFLAYATTASSARRMGSGDRAGAAAAGVDGLWLAVIIGALVAAVLVGPADTVARLFGAQGQAAVYAAQYLRIAGLGVPAMLATMAVTGVLRGFQDTRTPLVATILAFSANLVLNLVFVLGLGWGVRGSAAGSLICQVAMAVGLVLVFVSRTRGLGFSLAFRPAGVMGSLADGVPLLVRTLALRGALVATTWVAARLGEVPMASYQVTTTVWGFLTMVLDALGIAGQALTGAALGAGEADRARRLTATMTWWGLWSGVVLGVGVLAVHTVLPVAFSPDPQVRDAVAAGLVVVALMQPLCGPVFVLDGVLIGAGDGRWLSGAQVVMLVAYLPMIAAVHLASPAGASGVVWLWVAFGGFMAVRGALLGWRARGDGWMRLGA
ncbi:MATE family efflux transporter [Acidipropionibacterium timonense]|uniref:MATE family efflux transporter n=1 Tax=Acidipropionibacterium timonense TaxID=2161818 RepID=UPI0010317FE0|nr:MATE family efflux transporter [Acidipropionibacterium timonense]